MLTGYSRITGLLSASFVQSHSSAHRPRREPRRSLPDPMGQIKGMRNLIAHSYGSMSREIIWETAVTDIPVLKQFCQEYLAKNTQPDT